MNLDEFIITIFVSIIGSGALWGFLEYMLDRKDKKNDCSKKILKAIDDLSERVDKIDKDNKERDAVTARVRILRFMDELLDDKRHSKDSFDQVYSDITNYERYCSDNPDFKNNQTATTIEYINKVYQERLEKHDFL